MAFASLQPIVYPDRETWLASRKNAIGASDVATILGFNPYKSAFSLWQEMKGHITPFEGNLATRMGHFLEPLAATLYEEATGQELEDPGPYTVFEHPDMPFFRCTPDRLTKADPRRAVELKALGLRSLRSVDDGEAPLVYQIQLQAQLSVLGFEYGDLAIIEGNESFRIHPFERNDVVINHILERVDEFHHRLVEGNPPPVDGSESTATTLRLLYPEDNGETVVLPSEAVEAAHQMEILKAQAKDLESQIRFFENVLKEAIGENTYGVADGIRYSYKTQHREGYTVQPTSFRVLRRMKG